MTKFSAFLAASAFALSGVTALAADLPIRAPAPAPLLALAPFSWNGFYVGLHAGYGWTRGDTVGIHSIGGGGAFLGNIGSADPKGFLGGGQIGYNFQYGSIVYGIEGDASFTRRSASATGAFIVPPITVTVRERENWFGSIRGRLGVAADRFLFYVTGGVGFTNVRSSGTVFAAVPGSPFNVSQSKTRIGWVGGAGVEYAFTNNFTARVEGLYYDVRKYRVSTNKFFGNSVFTEATPSHALVRLGVNYKF